MCECLAVDDVELSFYRLPVVLPPLPMPDYAVRRSQAVRGALTVCTTCALLIGVTGGCSLRQPSSYAPTLLVLVVVEAAVALLCLAALMLVDPGVVKRTQSSVQPVPDEVATRLKERAPLRDEIEKRGGMSNIREGSRSYCVRCFVWREHTAAIGGLRSLRQRCRGGDPELMADVAVHHCRICARCVRHFDHHCSALGRCIAGRGVLRGNIVYFRTLIAMAWMGVATASVALGLYCCG